MTEQTYAAATWYDERSKIRDGVLKRARQASKLTIPFVFPPEGHSYNSEFEDLNQSIGARGVNNLASRLLLSLLPPNTPFFKLAIDKFELEAAKEEGDEGFETELNKALGIVERAVMTEVETSSTRVHTFEFLRQLIIGGNSLYYVPQDEKESDTRVYKLDTYCIKRDPDGQARKIVIRESLSKEEVPEGVPIEHGDACPECDKEDGKYYLYTVVERQENNTWKIHQEINGVVVKDSEGSYPQDKNPWIPARFNKVDGLDYGESYISEYIGDLISIEILSEAINQATAAAAKVIFLVRPNGSADPKVLTSTPNGGFAQGEQDDVVALQLDKQADMATANTVLERIKEDLAKAFMLNTSIQRSGERVTAEEIRYMAQELENGIGGIHSILSSDFSRHLVSALMHRMQKAGRLPELPKNIVKTQIVTGIDAIGRGNDLTSLRLFIQEMIGLFGPEVIAQRMNFENVSTRIATATGVDMEGLLKSEDQIQQETQQAQQQALLQAATPNAVKAAGDVMQNQQQTQ